MIMIYSAFSIVVVIVIASIFLPRYVANKSGRNPLIQFLRLLCELVFVLLFPVLYLLVFDAPTNDCCGDTASFSPEHRLSIYVLLGICMVTYFVSSYRSRIFTPVLEVLLNCFLIIGSILSLLVLWQAMPELQIFAFAFCLPVTIFFIMVLVKNHFLFIDYANKHDFQPEDGYSKFAWLVLTSNKKYLFLTVLCIPVLVILTSFLILFGQKPDSMIRAFTDTYRHGFSQMDYMCENVTCGGHFLCSVAANGHKNVVQPVRLGERLGKPIVCNRQLLVANAFEELLYDKMPEFHSVVRHNYNRVGNVVHRYYGIFNNKYVADSIYFLMKPAEWLFLFTLYLFDRNPENRISKQYLTSKDRNEIENK